MRRRPRHRRRAPRRCPTRFRLLLQRRLRGTTLRKQVETVTEDLLRSILPVVAPIDPNGSPSLADQLVNVATAGFIGELEAERLEFESEGWTRSGTYEIERVEVLSVDMASAPPTASVRACIDTSGLVITRADGERLPSNQTRAWNVFMLEQVDGMWRIHARTFTDNPEC